MNLSQGNLSSFSSNIKTKNNYQDINNFNTSYNVYSTIREIKKRKKSDGSKKKIRTNFRNNNSKISFDFDNINSQNNDLSLKNSSCIKYKSENISTYKQLNTTNNTSNIFNNNESISTYPSNLKKKIIIELPGKNFLINKIMVNYYYLLKILEKRDIKNILIIYYQMNIIIKKKRKK